MTQSAQANLERFDLTAGFRVISGGQSGADAAALDWALAHGVQHGGWCPKGRRSEDGTIPARYLLDETPSANYLQRTEWNVRDSDATLIFTLSDDLDGGSKRTSQFAERLGRPTLQSRPSVHEKFVVRFLAFNNVTTLNVAGKRESSAPGIHRFAYDTLDRVLNASARPTN